MTIRVKDPLAGLARQRIAAAVTAAVLNPGQDEAKVAMEHEPAGIHWLRWGGVLPRPKVASRLD